MITGKAWEYGLAVQCAEIFGDGHAQFIMTDAGRVCRNAYAAYQGGDQQRIDKAAKEAALFLLTHDARLDDTRTVRMQSDQQGRLGDVRDILIETSTDEEIGISAKHRHKALKHPRLSDSIDFGEQWYGVACSSTYWEQVNPIFKALRERTGEFWSDLPRKHEDVYSPVLDAFSDEIRTRGIAGDLLRYMVGRHDFYKVVKANGEIVLQSFNLAGSLKWGDSVRLPHRIVDVSRKPRSPTTTVIVIFDEGWQLSFRLHNAKSEIEPSLKFDVQLIGTPDNLSRHVIPF